MALHWQDLVALTLIVVAVFYLLRRLRRIRNAKTACRCGACHDCPADTSPPPLVSIEPPKKP